MFDYLRNLTKSAKEKQQEALNAYLDDALSPKERQQFEQRLARDADLRLMVEQRRALQMQMRQMPRRRVPHNFTLDPAVYGRPQPQPLFQLYPAMRVALVLTAFFFILALSIDLFLPGQADSALMSDVAMVTEEMVEEPAVEAPFAAQAVEVTRVVTETVVEEAESAAGAEPASAAEDTTVAAEMMEAPAEEGMAETAEFFTEDALPLEASPAPPTDTTINAADAGDAVEQESTAALLATPAPALTFIAPTVAATKSTVPRPEAETAAGERAITDVPETLDGELAATAVPAPQPSAQPFSGVRLLQIGLGVLLVLLGTAVFYVRRQL